MLKKLAKTIISLIFALLLTLSLSSCTSKKINETNTFKIVNKIDYNLNKKETIKINNDDLNAINKFSYKTFKSIYEPNNKDNYIYSPASYYMALSLLTQGANNDTLKELLNFQEVSSMNSIKDINMALFNNNNYNNDKGKARIANSFWVDLNLNLKDEYVKSMEKDYKAEGFKSLMNSETADNVVKWINNNTFDFLKMKSSDIDLEAIVLLLVNTIYFENKWLEDYKKEVTSKDYFYTTDEKVLADFMHHTVTNKYYETKNYQVASDAFYNGNTITYILPSENYSIDEMMSNNELYDILLDNMEYTYCKLKYSLPKFKYQKTYDLKKASEKIGLTNIFDPSKCDLSKISDEQLYVSYIKQIAGIELSEEGVKASAVTIIGDKATSVGPADFKIINLNRPFIYFIKDSANTIIFMGIINNPIA